ncbi:hypothetical protein [Falsiroseomonas sp. CW058]|uniref:hypothetical protein n=1 Tax=Falsiroseomonas sp. CW058 TaxID=3388664 RepID=UPI003D321D0F
MEEFFASGRAADLVLLVMAAEAALLLAWRRRSGRGPSPGAVMALVLPGAALVLALRVALTGGWWGWVALCLLAALAAHLADLRGRWRG